MATKFFSNKGVQKTLQSEFGDLVGGVSGGGDLVAESVQRSREFDPSAAVDEFGSGFLEEAREGLGEDFEDLVGESVGAGRLRTGFFQNDAGRLFKDFNSRVARAVALQSLNAAQLDLQNIQGQGRVGLDLLTQQADVLGGAFDRGVAEENADGGSIFGKILGGAAGLVLPGIGSKIGEKLGDKISGAFD